MSLPRGGPASASARTSQDPATRGQYGWPADRCSCCGTGEGSVRVFHNVCSHRGHASPGPAGEPSSRDPLPLSPLVLRPCGSLERYPECGRPRYARAHGLRPHGNGLKPVRSAVWLDLVFVDLSGDGAGLRGLYRAARRALVRLQAGPTRARRESLSSDRIEVAANWKLAVENYCEAYHLPTVHPDLNTYSRLEDHFNIEEPGSFSGQGSRVYQPTLSDDGRGFPNAPGLSERWAAGADYISLYPNLLLGIHKDHFFALRLSILSPLTRPWRSLRSIISMTGVPAATMAICARPT